LLKINSRGDHQEVAKGERNGPWNGVDYSDGGFFIAEGGVMEGGRILRVSHDGRITRLVENLPSYGDHHTNGVVAGADGFIYFGQGTATNSGVAGKDNAEFGWLKRHKEFHDMPCTDIRLRGENFGSENILSADHEKVYTGAYSPYGQKTNEGQVVKGQVPCNGAIMKVPKTGGLVQLVAWGFRNPFGLAFTPSGELYATDNGYDMRGSRPVFGTGDLLWKVQPGAWYGWPDFSGEDSLAGCDYHNPSSHPKPLLMEYPGRPPRPAAVFGVHSSADGFAFSKSEAFGYKGHAFVAQFGDMAPNVGSIYAPVGFKVVKVDAATGEVTDFAVNRGKINGPASTLKTGGLERPVSVKFSPDGNTMYIVDFGVLEVTKQGPAPKQKTGMIWKVVKG
jgi:glucose/arabinose dehydrogenase